MTDQGEMTDAEAAIWNELTPREMQFVSPEAVEAVLRAQAAAASRAQYVAELEKRLSAPASAKMEFKPVGSNEHMIVRGTPEVIDALKERLTRDYRLAASAPNPSVEPVANDLESERKKFESQMHEGAQIEKDRDGIYVNEYVDCMFKGWLMHRNAAPIANPSDKQVTKITNAMLDAAVAAFKDRPEYSVRESMRAAIAASLPQSAEQDRIDAERWRMAMEEGFISEDAFCTIDAAMKEQKESGE